MAPSKAGKANEIKLERNKNTIPMRNFVRYGLKYLNRRLTFFRDCLSNFALGISLAALSLLFNRALAIFFLFSIPQNYSGSYQNDQSQEYKYIRVRIFGPQGIDFCSQPILFLLQFANGRNITINSLIVFTG